MEFGIDLFINICRLVLMSDGGYWTNMVTGVDDGVSLEDFSIPMTQETQANDEVRTEVEAVDVQACVGVPRPRATRPN